MNKILKLARKKNTYTFVFYQSKEEHIQKRGIIAIEREKNSYILLTILWRESAWSWVLQSTLSIAAAVTAFAALGIAEASPVPPWPGAIWPWAALQLLLSIPWQLKNKTFSSIEVVEKLDPKTIENDLWRREDPLQIDYSYFMWLRRNGELGFIQLTHGDNDADLSASLNGMWG